MIEDKIKEKNSYDQFFEYDLEIINNYINEFEEFNLLTYDSNKKGYTPLYKEEIKINILNFLKLNRF